MRLSCLLLVLTLAPAPLGAQYDSTTVAGRAILRRFETIGQDPAVQALTESGIDLFGENSSMSSMDDSTMALLIGLMAAWMKGDERGTCRVFLSQREDGFNIRLAQVTDSVEAESGPIYSSGSSGIRFTPSGHRRLVRPRRCKPG